MVLLLLLFFETKSLALLVRLALNSRSSRRGFLSSWGHRHDPLRLAAVPVLSQPHLGSDPVSGFLFQ